jgi:N-acetylmuramoyl-L-alanine amidase
VLLDAGHGLSNSVHGKYDPGAVSGCGEEAAIVREISEGAQQLCRFSEVSILPFPECDFACMNRHVWSSHLGYKIKWANRETQPFDFIVSLHLNSAKNPDASGVEVFYSDGAPLLRKKQARAAAAALAEALGLPNRGIKAGWQSQHSRLAILDDTKAPALLFELGFITNPVDVEAVRKRGVEAVLRAIKAITEAK